VRSKDDERISMDNKPLYGDHLFKIGSNLLYGNVLLVTTKLRKLFFLMVVLVVLMTEKVSLFSNDTAIKEIISVLVRLFKGDNFSPLPQ